MKLLMITWTDVFYAIGDFFQWIFKGMFILGHIPNVLIWLLIVGILGYWIMRLSRYKKTAARNNTIE
jgi:ribose/xylose/arabinose/galactoside ABC-type transport system permease subunit